jgi:hypothetical protein
MIQFFVHEKSDTVGVATVDIQAGDTVFKYFLRNDTVIYATENKELRKGT